MFDILFEKCISERRWTREKAKQFLEEIKPILDKAGYEAKIVGSVATKGWSDKDLDLLLTTTREDFDFEILNDYFGGMDCGLGTCWARINWDEHGRAYKVDYPFEKDYFLVDFFFEE